MKGILVVLFGTFLQKASSLAIPKNNNKLDEAKLIDTEVSSDQENEMTSSNRHQSLDHLSRSKRSIFDDFWLYETLGSSKNYPTVESSALGNNYRSAFYDMALPAYFPADHRQRSFNKRASGYTIPEHYRIFPAKNKFRGNLNCKVFAWKTPRACRYQ